MQALAANNPVSDYSAALFETRFITRKTKEERGQKLGWL